MKIYMACPITQGGHKIAVNKNRGRSDPIRVLVHESNRERIRETEAMYDCCKEVEQRWGYADMKCEWLWKLCV